MSRPVLSGGSCNRRARQPLPPARPALGVVSAHGAELLAEGYFETVFANPIRGIAVEETDRLLCELAVRGHLEADSHTAGVLLLEREAPPYGELGINILVGF
jgi:hypothetical protein